MDSLYKQPKQRNMDMKFGTLNVKSLCKSRSPLRVSWELSKYKLDLLGLHEVRWDGGGTDQAEYTFLSGKGNEIMN
jgi:hypothetical protein